MFFDKVLKWIMLYVDGFWGIIYPNICRVCDQEPLIGDSVICLNCKLDLPFFTGNQNIQNNEITDSFFGRLIIEGAWGVYYLNKGGTVEHLVYSFKYKGRSEVATYCGKLLGEIIATASVGIDYIIPAPTTRSRIHKRGYNQAFKIAEGVQSVVGKPILDILSIKKNKKSSSKMSRIERFETLEGSIKVKSKSDLAEKNVLIVDDVITTGATLEACSKVLLKDYDNVSIYIAVVAVATR